MNYTINLSQLSAALTLDDTRLGILMRAVITYDGEEEPLSGELLMAYRFIIGMLEEKRGRGNPNFKKGERNKYYPEIIQDNSHNSAELSNNPEKEGETEIIQDNSHNSHNSENYLLENSANAHQQGDRDNSHNSANYLSDSFNINNINNNNISKNIKIKEILPPLNSPPKKKREINFNFIEEEFRGPFERWLSHKRAKGSMYKTQDSVETAYRNLKKLSGDSPTEAEAIVEHSIANNYQGLFPSTVRKREIYHATDELQEF